MTLQNSDRKAQKQMILQLLEQGKKLTPLDALKPPINCMRLGARCWDLRQDGHDVRTEMIKLESGKRVAQYSLKKTA